MACTDGKNTYLNIKELPVINDIVPGDFMIIETPSATSILDFQNFLITLDNTTFGGVIAQNTTDIVDLSSSIVRIDDTINNLEIDITGLVESTIVDTMSTLPISASHLYYDGGTLSRRNKLINGDFSIWQRGTTATYPVSARNVGNKLADRWTSYSDIVNNNDNGTVSITRMAAGVDELPYFKSDFYLRKIHSKVNINQGRTLLYDLSSNAYGALAIQDIENVRQILGKEVTLSFWARTHTGSSNVQLLSESQIHSTDRRMFTPTIHKLINITDKWQKYTHTYTMPTYEQVVSVAYDPTQIQNKATGVDVKYVPLGTDIPPLSSWYYQVDIKDFWSLGGAIEHGNSDGRPIGYPGEAMTANELSAFTTNAISTGYYDIAEIQLEEGSVATPFEFRHPTEELALCQRYYEKSDFNYVLGAKSSSSLNWTNTIGQNGNIIFPTVLLANNTFNYNGIVSVTKFNVEKYTKPTLTLYAPANGTAGNVSIYSGYNMFATSAGVLLSSIPNTNAFATTTNLMVTSPLTPSLTASNFMGFYWVADAEMY